MLAGLETYPELVTMLCRHHLGMRADLLVKKILAEKYHRTYRIMCGCKFPPAIPDPRHSGALAGKRLRLADSNTLTLELP